MGTIPVHVIISKIPSLDALVGDDIEHRVVMTEAIVTSSEVI
jgi:hypothetical protein